jgi:hypothetical protein
MVMHSRRPIRRSSGRVASGAPLNSALDRSSTLMLITRFRILIVVAAVFHAVGLFVLPHLEFLFSADVKQLMAYGGHGAHVAMSHPLIYGLYLVPFAAFVGLYLLRGWGRHVLAAYLATMLLGSFFFGTSVSGPPETFVSLVAVLADGAILGLTFLSPLSSALARSNFSSSGRVVSATGADERCSTRR